MYDLALENLSIRSVAQFGSAPHWGCGGRRFKSGRSDQTNKKARFMRAFLFILNASFWLV